MCQCASREKKTRERLIPSSDPRHRPQKRISSPISKTEKEREKIAPAAIPSRARKTSNLSRGLSAILIQTPLEPGKRHRGKSFFARLMVSEPSPEHPPAPERDAFQQKYKSPFSRTCSSLSHKKGQKSFNRLIFSKKKR